MASVKEQMAQAAERLATRRGDLEAEARSKGVQDVEAYARAILELEYGPPGDPADAFEPEEPQP